MSEPTNVIQDTNLLIDETTKANHLKRAASAEAEETREMKAIKLEIAQRDCEHAPHIIESSKEEVAAQEENTNSENKETQEIKQDNNNNLETTTIAATTETETAAPATTTNTTTPPPASTTTPPTTNSPATNTNNNTILSMTNGPTPPPGLHLLSDPQQQQLIQSYVQAQGQDLANLTASSLAQAMVSPIAVPNLASNLLHQLQQGGNVITALPGPPQLPPSTGHPNGNSPLQEDGTAGTKRSGGRSMSNDERRQRRLLRNRVAAKECRKKKKQHIHEMEEKIVRLEEENSKLAKEVEELKMQGSESYRLMKEVEELNAKLGLGHLSSASAAAAVLNASHLHNSKQETTPSNQQPSSSSPHQSANVDHTSNHNINTNSGNLLL